MARWMFWGGFFSLVVLGAQTMDLSASPVKKGKGAQHQLQKKRHEVISAACAVALTTPRIERTAPVQSPSRSSNSEIYVLDTNMFYNDPAVLDRLSGKTVVIPTVVIEELDRHKGEFTDRAQTARTVSATIRRLLKNKGESPFMTLPSGGQLVVSEVSPEFKWPQGLKKDKVDHAIIALALEMQRLNSTQRVVVLTGDNNVAILADSYGLKTDELETEVKQEVVQEIMDGPIQLVFEEADFAGLNLKQRNSFTLEEIREMGYPMDMTPHQGQYLLFRASSGDAFDLEDALTRVWRFHVTAEGKQVFSPLDRARIRKSVILPRNEEQIMALDLLLDNRISLVSLAGRAGTGKTLITLSAGLALSPLLRPEPAFDRIILTRPHQVTGQDVGYLPGSLQEKMEPYLGPFKDNLAVWIETFRARKSEFGIFTRFASDPPRSGARASNGNGSTNGSNGCPKPRAISIKEILDETIPVKELVERILKSEVISFEAITYSRGRSWERTLLIIDEAQNLTLHEARTILTRAGNGTKVVLLGDIDQIDNKHLNHTNNGLIITASRFRGKKIAGHVTLTQGERSELSTMASELLRP